jgi:hypothetical protein
LGEALEERFKEVSMRCLSNKIAAGVLPIQPSEPQNFTFVSMALENTFPPFVMGSAEPENDVPVGELRDLSEATLIGIRQGIAEVTTGQSSGPFSLPELSELIGSIAER